jgi:hypothetical protein
MKADNEISLDGEILAEETTTPFRVTVLQWFRTLLQSHRDHIGSSGHRSASLSSAF